MNPSDAYKDRVIAATRHIHDALAKSIEEMQSDLMKHFHLDARQLNYAIARAAILTMAVCTTSAAGADGRTPEELANDAMEIGKQVEAIMNKSIGVDREHENQSGSVLPNA